MKTRSKIAMAIAASAMVGVMGVAGVLAWMTDNDAQTNDFTIGKVDIDLDEHGPNSSSFVQDQKLIPGSTIAKQPFITLQAGSEESYVYIEVTLPEKFHTVATIEGLDVPAGWTQVPDTDQNNLTTVYRYNKTLDLDKNTADKPDKTGYLFTSVKIKDNATEQMLKDAADAQGKVSVPLKAFAIQAANVDVVKADAEAVAYFEKN